MRQASKTAAIVLLLVLTVLAGVAASQRSPHPARSIQLAATSPGLPHLVGWQRSTTTTTAAPPVTAPQKASRATERPAASRSRGTARPAASGGSCSRPSTCPQLRQCENGGSYQHGTSSQFDGAYQFADRSKWGMSPTQQDAAADQMYAERGAAPWPVCGRYLR